ncbi:carbohydrate ABC transporter permease [Streptomyces griseorubiginosus]|uniref:carbohydrate ABC transporter permease n=1 Tax=Streptomyces griseorubiginosus TaxID=67304 RepID=UPI002E820F8E|nr:carbohydrate ABC transporter permease [Streptomyces griseorubiginosus]WUB47305.1 carbohydrate ABC transporter permease [Streptomyces griseorubiginosus]WUB55829.1 carbohydrate ABC transporter permease [Streptomyces griseorubiginosus]
MTAILSRLRTRGWLTSVYMLPLSAVMALPFYYVLVNTLKSQAQTTGSPLALPTSPDFSTYRRVLDQVPVAAAFANTLYVTVVSVALMVLIGAMAAYALTIRPTRFNRRFGKLLLLAFVVPTQSTLIPVYQIFVKLNLVNSLNGLVLVYSAGSIFCWFVIQGYMATLPFEVIEAARLDGCGPWQVFWRIVLPLIRPILATVAVFQTMWIWNDFFTPNVYLSDPGKSTIVLEVYTSVGQFQVDWPAFLTLSVMALVPMVVFFVAVQRHIVSGLLSGAVKG